MVAYRIIGNNLVSEDGFIERNLDVKIAAALSGEKIDNLMLNNGAELVFAPENIASPEPIREGRALPDIGYGKPLTVEIVETRAGELGSEGDEVAVVSRVKNWSVFKANARALNFVSKRKGPEDVLPPPGSGEGTPVVAYQKAVTTRQIEVGVQIGTASRYRDVAATVAGAFRTAAGIPLLMPYAGILLTASKLFPIAARFADSLRSDRMPWKDELSINLGRPVGDITKASYRIMDAGARLGDRYRYVHGVGLIGPGDTPYRGRNTYVVVAIHGFEDSELEAFTPTVASAELLEKFHLAQSAGGGPLDGLVNIIGIASDYKFREQAMRAKQRMEQNPDTESEAYKTAKAEFDAAVKNIVSEELKPKP